MQRKNEYLFHAIPYALAAFLIGIVGGFSTVLAPAFVQDIGIDYNNTTWTALAQAMSTAALAPILGKLGDRIGRKPTLLLGLAVFLLGNVLTACSMSFTLMLVARFIVGAGTAAIAPVILSYIVTEFPKDKVAGGFSAYMLISSAAVIFGPTLGSVIVSRSGWRAMIWLCVGLSAAVLIACGVLGEKLRITRRTLPDFDGLGAVFVLLFFSLILCIPAVGQNIGWQSGAFFAVLAGALLSFVGLIAAERKAAYPILPAAFMKRPAFLLSVLILFLTQGLMQSNMTNTIVFVNTTQPENTVISGYAISVMYLGMSLGAAILGPMVGRCSVRSVLTASLLTTALGCACFFLYSPTTSVLLLMLSLGLVGFGLGGNGTILMNVSLRGLPPHLAGAASGTYGLFRDLSAPFGVAVFVPMFTNRITQLQQLGIPATQASVTAIYTLGFVQLACIAVGIAAVRFLPKKEGPSHETA